MFTWIVPLLLVLVVVPRAAEAQVDTSWDIAATAGLLAGYTPRTDRGAGYEEQWFHVAQGALRSAATSPGT